MLTLSRDPSSPSAAEFGVGFGKRRIHLIILSAKSRGGVETFPISPSAHEYHVAASNGLDESSAPLSGKPVDNVFITLPSIALFMADRSA